MKKSLTAKWKESIGHDFEFSRDMDDLCQMICLLVWTQTGNRDHFYLENFNLVVRLTSNELYLT